MKSIKNIALSAMLTIGAFSAVTYTACTKDECEDVVCNNGGTCVSGNCSCPSGYEGNQCETRSNTKFAGNYDAEETCSPDNYQVTIAASASDPTKVTISNLGSYGCSVGGDIVYNGSVDQATITVADNKCGYQINATGTYNNGVITMTYTAIYNDGSGTQTDNCSVTLTKQ